MVPGLPKTQSRAVGTDKQKEAQEAALSPHQEVASGLSLAVRWLALATFTAVDLDSIPGWKLRFHKTCSVAKYKNRVAERSLWWQKENKKGS